MLSWRLLLRTGEEKYADLIERTLLNNVLASPRADGKAFYYANTLHQLSEAPAEAGDGYLLIRRTLTAGDVIRLRLPLTPRITWPDPRIDAVRGDFTVEAGPLVLALESTDLPEGWSVNDIQADPDTVTVTESGPALRIARRSPDESPWPYQAAPVPRELQHITAPLIPYHAWANRGPSTMRVWIPMSTSDGAQ